MTGKPSRERLFDLLADRALEGLSPEQEAELACLLIEHPDVNPLSLDLAAAVLYQSSPDFEEEPLPAPLARMIESQAHLSMPSPGGKPRPASGNYRVVLAAAWSGWVVAACLLFALLFPWRNGAVTPTLQKRYDDLVATAGTVRLPGAAPDPNAQPDVRGEVIWNPSLQQGFLKLRGIPVNDPTRRQYQLWIFDAIRNKDLKDPPVDGGVFDIKSSSNEILIPITARLPVAEPTLFAITEEPAGGVVVSDRKRMVLVAAVR